MSDLLCAFMKKVDFSSKVTGYFDAVTEVIDRLDKDQFNTALNVLLDAYNRGAAVYTLGNGGSAATASHIVCDFNKGVSLKLDKKFRFTSLCDNTASLMAIANDCGYEHVFEYQLEGKLVSGDVLIAISGSGNSENVLRAVRYAKDQGCTIIAMTGYNGGKLRLLADCSIHVPINDMQKVEDVHMMALHLMAQTLAMYFGHPMC